MVPEIFNPNKTEQKEAGISPEYVKVGENALRGYLRLKPEEKTLLLSDKDTNKETEALLKQAIINIGSELGEIKLSKKIKREDIQELLKQYQAVIDISVGSHDSTSDIFDDIIEYKNRLLALYDIDKEAFNPDGPIAEKAEDLAYRLNKIEALLHDAVGFKITSGYGTNLEVPLRIMKERRWAKETGIVSKPGDWDNFLPTGEVYTTPDETKVAGVLMLPAIESAMKPHQGVDEFIRVEIKDGFIVKIDELS